MSSPGSPRTRDLLWIALLCTLAVATAVLAQLRAAESGPHLPGHGGAAHCSNG